MPGTTHNGGGRPRLIPVLGGSALVTDPERPFTIQVAEIELVEPATVLGSGPEVDVQLEGLELVHARFDHDERDEWVVRSVTEVARTRVNGEVVGQGLDGQALHTGDRVDLGPWSFSFFRDEDADHGRPFGGRQGGEFSVQQPQAGRDEQP